MPTDVAVACGGLPAGTVPADFAEPSHLALGLAPPAANVRLRASAVHSLFPEDLAPELLDLLEVAAYVYAADQSAPRSNGADALGDGWRRRFRLRVPVRLPDLWNSRRVGEALTAALAFLTDDEYRFEFAPHPRPGPVPRYLDFGGEPFAGRIDEVALYSGGLDSLAGAVEAAANRGRRALLVRHRSTEKWTPAIEDTLATLKQRLGGLAPATLTVDANKSVGLTRDANQRSRMFLYAAFGSVAALALGMDSLRVYENGVVGLNLPLLGQLVGARASRTTHPKSLDLLGRFLSELAGRPFALENPFLWKTKADVVRLIDDAGHADLIGPAISCGQTIRRSNARTHCGVCSQCLDRRFGVLAAGLGAADPASQYEVGLAGVRAGEDLTMLVGFLGRARRVHGMGEIEFLSAYGEVARAMPRGAARAGDLARRVYDLYRRHSADVLGVVEGLVQGEAPGLARGEAPSQLVAIVVRPPAVVVEVPAPEPDYLFRRAGDVWLVRFEGSETAYVKDLEGMGMIARLLACPHAGVGALELAGVPAAAPGTPPPQAGVPLADRHSLAEYRTVLRKINDDLAQAREAGDLEGAEDLEERQQMIRGHIGSVTTAGGKIRKAHSDLDRARKLVVNNVNNAITLLRKHRPELADHFDRHLVRAAESRYAPPAPLPWETEADVGTR